MNRWTPADQPTDAATLVSDYERTRRPDGRPWVEMCMISSLDGAVSVDGLSGGLGSDADVTVLRALRGAADVVLVGARTALAEGYGPPRRPGLRVGVVTTGRSSFDPSTPLFSSGAGFLILPTDAPSQQISSIRAGLGKVDLAAAMRQLDATVIHVEGGPRLNGELLGHDLVDEVNLTIAPFAAGGTSSRIVEGAAERLRRFDLHRVAGDDSYLFLQYVRNRRRDR